MKPRSRLINPKSLPANNADDIQCICVLHQILSPPKTATWQETNVAALLAALLHITQERRSMTNAVI
jgi:hypothetical protein